MDDDPSVHPMDRPHLRVIMLFSLVAGTMLLCAAGGVDGSYLASLVGAGAWLSFAIFVVTFGVVSMAWVLREHERWRRHHAKKSG